jgi:addiction module HigA family antidote
MLTRNRRPTNPGKILKTYYLEPRALSIAQLARATGLSRKQVSGVANGRTAVSPDTAVRFARVLDTTARFWLNLQNAVDLYDVRQRLAGWQPSEVHPAKLTVE